MGDLILAAKGVSKQFPGVKALDRVSFDLEQGQVHALLGENGAGKSTFVKILTGVYQRDEGSIAVGGVETHFRTPADAYAAGVSIVFQELSQAISLTVAENIYLGEWPTKGPVVDWRAMNRMAAELLDRFHVQAAPDDRIEDLGIGTRQMVEILKGCRKPHTRILILDEPTSALSEPETETLFVLLRALKERGVAIIYISHRLGEIQRICDRITVFRNGRNVGTGEVGAIGADAIVSMMVGRDLAHRFPPKAEGAKTGGLSVRRLSSAKLRSIAFEARRGEVLGLSGLIGAGKTEVLRALFGADRDASKSIELDGRAVAIDGPRAAIRMGFGFLPESRKDQALVLTANNVVNVSVAALKRFATPFLALGRERSEVNALMQRVEVRPPDPDNMVVNLSGGNQQKIILARWLLADSSVLLFDEPTRGIDVGARYQIYATIVALANRGCCVIVASSDVDELAGICNRVLVLAKGAIVAQFSGSAITEETLLHAAAAEPNH